MVSKNDIRQSESNEHIGKFYDGSIKMFLTSFLSKEKLTEDEAKELKMLIDKRINGEEL